MSSSETHPSLLVRMRDPQDSEAWRQFESIYRPLIYGFARKRLQEVDAENLTQNVCLKIVKGIRNFEYDPTKASFRGWLFTIVQHEYVSFARGERSSVRGSGDSGVQGLLDNLPDREEFDHEFARATVRWAAEQVRSEFKPEIWLAFWKTAIEGKSLKQTAAELGSTPGAIALRKRRILMRVKEAVAEVSLG